MKRTIRLNVFETNSSSVHSIVIDTRTPDAPYESDAFSDGGEFGWEHENYFTPQERLNYIWQGICQTRPATECMGKWADAIREWMPNAELVIPPEDNWDRYIDHVWELSDLIDRMDEDHDLLGRFLLGANSKVETWNDNIDGYVEEMFSYPEDPNYEVFIKDC